MQAESSDADRNDRVFPDEYKLDDVSGLTNQAPHCNAGGELRPRRNKINYHQSFIYYIYLK